MRKAIHLLFVLFLVFVWCTTFAQDTENSIGPIPIMKADRNHTIVSTPNILASTALAYNNTQQMTMTMPLPAGTPFTLLSSWVQPSFAIAMARGGDDNFYMIDVLPALFQVDLGTGAVTSLGSITGLVDQVTGFAYNPVNGNYYLCSIANFYSFDLSTRVATLIGSLGMTSGGLMIDICFDAAGTCYSYEVNVIAGAANGYTINISTGAATPLGYLGYTPNYGQGMGYDFETSTIYLSAFNSDTFTGQLRTMDPNNGNTTLLTDWGSDQVAPFECDTYSIPCLTVSPATNPNPPSGTVNVPINLAQISWVNGAGATSIEVFFNGSSVYSGPPITSWALPGLNYATTYSWKVDGSDATCTKYGPTWTFTTIQDPNLVIETVDVYPQNADYWTGTCSASAKTQVSLVNAAGSDVGWMVFDISPIVNVPSTEIIDIVFNGYLYANNWPYWSITPMGSVNPITADAATINSQVANNYVQGVAYSYNQETATLTNGWLNRDLEDFAHTDMINVLGQGWFAIGFIDFDLSTSYYVDFQGWAEANRPYLTVTYTYVIPVELTSFTANASEGLIELSWITATETNNQGFEVQRSSGSEFETIAFVEGHGTTTESQAYSYADKNVNATSYSYRLKQVDFDGTFEYSSVVEVDVPAPAVFALEQNYPNPFNPSTKIAFKLAVDSKVSLKVFDILGQEVASLVNTNLVAGSHQVNFDASSLNSGVYMYRIEATGIDGTNFTSVKKMILTK